MKNASANKMGSMPVNKLLISMSLPIMISMLVQALYNIVDSMFVAKLSEDALTAVSLAFPMQNLMISVGSGIGVGMNAMLSKALGEKNQDRADKAAQNGCFLAFISYIIFLILGIFVSRIFFACQTDNYDIIHYGTIYLTICCCASLGLFTQMIFERMLQATGRTFYTMITQGTGAIINIILDPILIFGLCGMPKMGIAGAATATVIGQFVAGILALTFNHRKNHDVHLNFKKFLPDFSVIKHILAVGVPSIVMIAIGSVMTFGMNAILLTFSSTAAAVFGVYYKLQSFVFMPIFGLNNGMIPIIAYNYGAKEKERIIHTIRLSVTYAISIMIIGLFILQAFPSPLLKLFNASDNMLSIGIPALRIISSHFIFAGFSIVCSAAFQAFGNGIFSMFISIARQLLVLLPTAFLLSLTGVLDYVWLSFPIAEIVSVIMCIIFLKRIFKTILSKL